MKKVLKTAELILSVIIVIGCGQLQAVYEDIRSDKLMMRRRDTAHNEVLYTANGYVTAWFMWLLQDDAYAAEAFTGENPEIMDNRLYQDQKRNLKPSVQISLTEKADNE